MPMKNKDERNRRLGNVPRNGDQGLSFDTAHGPGFHFELTPRNRRNQETHSHNQ